MYVMDTYDTESIGYNVKSAIPSKIRLTSYAEFTSLKCSARAASPPVLSGWSFLASSLYARLTCNATGKE